MNQIGTPLPALSPQGGERVAEGRGRGGSWRVRQQKVETAPSSPHSFVMRFDGWAGYLLAVVLLFFGCKKGTETSAASSSFEESGPTNAPTKLPAIKLWLGAQELSVEVARTSIQVQTGMMFRTNMDETEIGRASCRETVYGRVVAG